MPILLKQCSYEKYKLNNDFIMLLDERRRCWSAVVLRLSVVSNYYCIQVFVDEGEKYDQLQSFNLADFKSFEAFILHQF